MGDSREGLRKEALVGGSVMTNRAALQSPPRISRTLQIPPGVSRSLYCRRPRIAGGTGHHVVADEKSMFRWVALRKNV